jgi:predicted lipoprotein
MKINNKLVALLISSSLLTACGGSGSDDTAPLPQPETGFSFDATEMITNLTNDVIVQGYQNLNDQAEQFYLAVLTLYNDPTNENLQAAQQAWKKVRTPWEQGEAHIFGPVDALSIDPHLDTWPLNTQDLQTLLSTQPSFSAEEVKGWNDDVQGFHTLEFLLFGDGVEDNHKDIAEMTALEREYLVAVADVFKQHTQSLYDAWVVDYQSNDNTTMPYKTLVINANNTIYSSQLGVVEELVNGLIGIVDEVGNGKIAEPFGSDIDHVDTSLVESQYSWNSLADFSNNIQGVLNIYRGEFPDSTNKQGLIDFVATADSTLATRIENEIVMAIESIDAIKGESNLPFRQAIKNQEARQRIQIAIDKLSLLQASLNDEVLPLLSQWNN